MPLNDYRHYAALAVQYIALARVFRTIPTISDSFAATAHAYGELAQRLFKFHTRSTIG